MQDLAVDRVGGIEDGEQEHVVGLLALRCLLGELKLHQLRRQQDRVSESLDAVCVVIHPRPLGQGTEGVIIERQGGHAGVVLLLL